jgi:hypothetical protein
LRIRKPLLRARVTRRHGIRESSRGTRPRSRPSPPRSGGRSSASPPADGADPRAIRKLASTSVGSGRPAWMRAATLSPRGREGGSPMPGWPARSAVPRAKSAISREKLRGICYAHPVGPCVGVYLFFLRLVA